jgi:hypothetical protein
VKRRAFVAIPSGAAAWPVIAGAQHQQIPRLCFLTFDPGTLRTRSPRFDGFFQGQESRMRRRKFTAGLLSLAATRAAGAAPLRLAVVHTSHPPCG